MKQQGVWQETFDFFPHRTIVVQPVEAYFSTDAGLLPLGQFDQTLGLTQQFAEALIDRRQGPALKHSFLEMTRMRVFGILAGYEDQNDHDALRRDAVFKLIAGRLPEDAELASQPTLSRFENAIGPASLKNLRKVFVEQFIASFHKPPRHLTFDVDCFDDPAHGQQQLIFFHGFYDQYQYLPRVITCAENDQVVMAALLFGTAPPSLGLVDDLKYLVEQLREAWPGVQITIRADSGFAVPEVYEGCEQLGIHYTIGLKMNPVLKRQSDPLLAEAVACYEQSGRPQRRFTAFPYQAGSWPEARFVVVKVEVNALGSNRRAVVTNRPGGPVLPEATYDEYAQRGESENRNKELKCSLHADRLSDHRFMANYFRLYLHCLAANLLARVRALVADPPPPDPPSDLPIEALAGRERKRHFNRRRQADPLGRGHAQTWRLRLIKVAAQITVSVRRVWVQLTGSWPFLHHYRQVSAAVNAFCSALSQGDCPLAIDSG